MDETLTPDISWALSEQALSVALPSGAQHGKADRDSLERAFAADSGLFFAGGLSFPTKIGAELVSVERRQDRWTLLLQSTKLPDQYRWCANFHVRWDTSLLRGFPESMRWESGPLAGAARNFAGWSETEIGLRAAHAVEEKSTLGMVTRTLRLRSCEPLSSPDLDAALAVPSAGSPDFVRGVVKFKAVYDYRPSPDAHAASDDVVVIPSGSGGVLHSRLRAAGWVLAAGLVLVLAWLRVRASSGSHKGGLP